MPSWHDYHGFALVLSTILQTIECVYLRLPGGNPPSAELKHRKANNEIISILRHQLLVLFPLLGVLAAVLHGCTVGST